MCNLCDCTCNKPLIIGVGKTYVDIQGSIVRIICKRKVTTPEYAEFIGLASLGGSSEVPHYYYLNGKCTFSPSCNLLREYKEPKVHERLVIWVRDSKGFIRPLVTNVGYQPTSKRYFSYSILKMQKIEYTEEWL